MKFDRHEIHVLNEMKELGYPGIIKIINQEAQHRLFVRYFVDNKRVSCAIEDFNGNRFYGIASTSPKEVKYKESIGRMIAFARAVSEYLLLEYKLDEAIIKNSVVFDSLIAEKIARGESPELQAIQKIRISFPPGSRKALSLGCKCSVLDNNYGSGYMRNPNQFVINEVCQMHGIQIKKKFE